MDILKHLNTMKNINDEERLWKRCSSSIKFNTIDFTICNSYLVTLLFFALFSKIEMISTSSVNIKMRKRLEIIFP